MLSKLFTEHPLDTIFVLTTGDTQQTTWMQTLSWLSTNLSPTYNVNRMLWYNLVSSGRVIVHMELVEEKME